MTTTTIARDLPMSDATTKDRVRSKGAWLFSRKLDLLVFGGSFALAMIALVIGKLTGVLNEETPTWAFVPAIVLCDVAHVWSTTFRTYLDREERRARPVLLTLTPIVAFAIGVLIYMQSAFIFWRVLAYVAIFHFVRQQYGWLSLYRARAGETGRIGKVIDTSAIYASTLYPLFYWHTHLPRHFSWFVDGDIVSLPTWTCSIAFALYVASLAAYAARSLARRVVHRIANNGKDLLVVTTAIAWYLGIVVFDSDYAFTVTNVFIHGIPYFALVYVHARARLPKKENAESPRSVIAALLSKPWTYIGALWLVAFVEELVWDRGVWHEHAGVFGTSWELASAQMIIVPLLAVPQIVHYVIDGFVWKRRSNPSVGALLQK